MTPGQRFINFFLRSPSSLRMRMRNALYRRLGARIGHPCWMQDVLIPRNPWEIEIHANAALDRHVVLMAVGESRTESKIVIGSGTYINRFTMIESACRVFIGRNCLISPQCYITDHDHGRLRGKPVYKQPLETAPVEIGDDVWLGVGVVVLKGVRIGTGAVVGAGAVVEHNVESFQVVAGVPTRLLRMREGEGGEPRTR
jgi:acetyltransferase-like isoleucine patch superfamily enzyme